VLHLAVTGYAGSPDLGGSFWLAVGAGGLLLAITNFADAAAPTIGQVTAEITYALDARRGGIVEDDEPEPINPNRKTIRVEEWALDAVTNEPSVRRARFYDLSLTPRQARELAAFVDAGYNFSEARLTERCQSIGSKVWDRLKNELLEHGLIRKKNPNQKNSGFEPTNKLRALARTILHSPITW